MATSEAELQELVDRLDRVSRKYNLLINIDKTKEIESDSIACRILIQNEQLEQENMFLYLGSTVTRDENGYPVIRIIRLSGCEILSGWQSAHTDIRLLVVGVIQLAGLLFSQLMVNDC